MRTYSDFLQLQVDLVLNSPKGKCSRAAANMCKTSIQIRELAMNLLSVRNSEIKGVNAYLRRDIPEYKGAVTVQNHDE
jgi:hypothetical protein